MCLRSVTITMDIPARIASSLFRGPLLFWRVHEHTDIFIDRVRPVKNLHGSRFSYAEPPQFLKEIAVAVVILQPLFKSVERIRLLGRGEIRPAEVEVKHRIKSLLAERFRLSEQGNGPLAGFDAAPVLLVDEGLHATVIGENNGIVGKPNSGLLQQAEC